MNLRPVISVPLPWLTFFTVRFFGKKTGASRARPFFKLPRTLSITKAGRWYIGILFLIGIAAINTANNLLYLVSSTLLSLIVVSGVISEHTMRRVRVERTLPPEVFKDVPVIVKVRITNGKRVFSSFSFNVSEAPLSGLKAEPVYVLKVRPHEETVRTTRYTFGHRGAVMLTGVRISTRFPFGLFLKGKEDESPAEALVYPSIRHERVRTLGAGMGAQAGAAPAGKGYGPQIYGLRGYTFEDDSRFIYWRAAARTSTLLVKEFEKEREDMVTVVFDNFRAPATVFEDLVDQAASIANHFSLRGFSVGLKTLDAELLPAPGHNQLSRILHALALITPASDRGVAAVRVM